MNKTLPVSMWVSEEINNTCSKTRIHGEFVGRTVLKELKCK